MMEFPKDEDTKWGRTVGFNLDKLSSLLEVNRSTKLLHVLFGLTAMPNAHLSSGSTSFAAVSIQQ